VRRSTLVVAAAMVLSAGVLPLGSAQAAPDPATGGDWTAAPTARPTPPRPRAVAAPKPAQFALPTRSGTGRRIVYSERTPQHVWLVDAHNGVVRDFAVSGRADWPRPGTFRVFSKSGYSNNPRYGVTFRWMVRFTFGHSAAIGFHSIPRYYNGKPMQTLSQLGRPVGRGGCPHSADANARFLYSWAHIGTKVVVVR